MFRQLFEKNRDCAVRITEINETVRPMKFAKNFAIPTVFEGLLATPSIALLGQQCDVLIIFLSLFNTEFHLDWSPYRLWVV